MPQSAHSLSEEQLELISNTVTQEVPQSIRKMLNRLTAADIAHLLESSPPKLRSILWNLLEPEHEGDVMQELGDEVQQFFLERMNVAELKALIEGQDTDDIVDLLQQLPESVTQQVLNAMNARDRTRVEAVLAYPEDSAGGLMNTDTITVRPHHTLDLVLRYLRRHDELPPMTDSLLVVNHQDKLAGILPIDHILVSDPTTPVRDIMVSDEEFAIPASASSHEVAQRFERQDLVSAPVIDDDGRLLGRITVDDVVDVIREEGEHSLMGSVGLDEDEDTFAPVVKSSQRRAIWLGVNLITAFIASGVIGLFQESIDKVVALAVLMPIVASMGGIAGSQTLTLVIRAIAQDQLSRSNTRWLVAREGGVGLINGVLWATVVALITWLWFDNVMITLVIACAMLINLLVAVISGALLPLILQRLRIDPALAGGVVLTTITDVVGFVSFLGLATLFIT